jgi:hypothetical protein
LKQNKSSFKWRHFDEAAHMMRKGQVKRFDGLDSAGRAKFVERLFGVAA